MYVKPYVSNVRERARQTAQHSTVGPERRKPRVYLEHSQGKGPCLFKSN